MTNDEGAVFMPSRRWRAVVACLLFALFLVVDQVTKVAVRAAVRSGFIATDVIPGIIEFRFAVNIGAAFSLGEGFGLVFVLLALAVVVFTLVYLSRAPLVSKLEVIGLGMLAGGAVGNAIDRLVFGYVTDFIATQFISFPIFNVADIGITCGAVIAFIGFMISPANKAEKETAQDDSPRADKMGERGAAPSVTSQTADDDAAPTASTSVPNRHQDPEESSR